MKLVIYLRDGFILWYTTRDVGSFAQSDASRRNSYPPG